MTAVGLCEGSGCTPPGLQGGASAHLQVNVSHEALHPPALRASPHGSPQSLPSGAADRPHGPHLACGRHREVEAVRRDADGNAHASEAQVALAQDGGQRLVGGLQGGKGPQGGGPEGAEGCRVGSLEGQHRVTEQAGQGCKVGGPGSRGGLQRGSSWAGSERGLDVPSSPTQRP